MQEEKRKEPFTLYGDPPSGHALYQKIEEFNSSTTGLIMTMVSTDLPGGFHPFTPDSASSKIDQFYKFTN